MGEIEGSDPGPTLREQRSEWGTGGRESRSLTSFGMTNYIGGWTLVGWRLRLVGG